MIETLPTGEQISQSIVNRLHLRHVRWRSHVGGTRGSLGRIVRRLGHEIGQVGLDAAQTLDVLVGGHAIGFALVAQLLLLLGADGAALALGLESLDFLDEVDVDVEEQCDACLFPLVALRSTTTGRLR